MAMTLDDIPQEERTRCEIWTRVMGYHRPVSAFNPGKRSEHGERQPFQECRTTPHLSAGHPSDIGEVEIEGPVGRPPQTTNRDAMTNTSPYASYRGWPA